MKGIRAPRNLDNGGNAVPGHDSAVGVTLNDMGRDYLFGCDDDLATGVDAHDVHAHKQGFVERWFFADDPNLHPAPGFDRYQHALSLAESAPAGSDGLMFLPWLNGAGPPTGEAFMRGGFLNQSLRSGRAHALRAVLEGVAYNLRWLLAAEEKFIGRRYGELKFSGGGAQSPLWCQILADVCDRPIRQIAEPNHAIVRGAAYLAMVALGRWQLDEIPRIVATHRTYQPNNENRDLYDAMFAEFVQAYRANRRLFARLNPRH